MRKNRFLQISSAAKHDECEDPWNRLSIDLDAIVFNYKSLAAMLPQGCRLYVVLKSDAYGHGIRAVSTILANAGCTYFAVESPMEGIALRNNGISGEILLLNPIPLWMADLSVRHDLSVSVIHHSILEPLDDAAAALDKKCRIHLNVNVGLNRLGIAPSRVLKIAREAASKPNLLLEGIYGQPRDPSSALHSYNRLKDIAHRVRAEGIFYNCLHFANSMTLLEHPNTVAGGVRIGILLYGVLPPERFKNGKVKSLFLPAMHLETQLVQVRQLGAGSRIGYHSRTKTERDSVIGTLPLGYYHGLSRKLIQGGFVTIKGKRAPFIGSISMNTSTINISNIPEVSIGDIVTIFGNHCGKNIGVNEIAHGSETIAAELMTRFGRSIPRIYKAKEKTEVSRIEVRSPAGEPYELQYMQQESELPEWLNASDIINFLKTHLKPYVYSEEVLNGAIGYALSSDVNKRGFLVLAYAKKQLLGVVIGTQQELLDIISQNMLVYVCVHTEFRGKGIGARLVGETVHLTGGDLQIYLKRKSPVAAFFKKLGFTSDYEGMRFKK